MGKGIGEGNEALICTPVMGRIGDEVLEELDVVLAKGPDVVEWRADFYANIGVTDDVLALAASFKRRAPETTMIFTIRSAHEGGEPIPLDARQAIELTAAVCCGTAFEYVDCELSNAAADVAYLREAARASGTKIIGSYHNFDRTPEAGFLLEKLHEAEVKGLDVAKVAVMPRGLDDVLTLLKVTLEARQRCRIPVVTMSMGGLGALTRMVGGLFGSALTFAVGKASSAPGQVPIEDLRELLRIVEKYR
ncbi:type I 3-dehydroquinate dehydratase [Geomesophilobacter sediminis]|uniref:3-dehydroquinate dehydratase n=1 Tax=Geomesophilobacter sediminis TaxID=2798584 RepID=A0A8J7JKP3_9BACT|nr:type I 3-dehydroquinate dehydratase [Geomesophilobacter sediminis]MBJ6724055.1 type I 3-dehydroquinate dehydratase [Geomesophilobacter sediminis]